MNEKKIIQLAIFVSLASTFQMGENMLPQILPGVKIGLANIFTIIVLFRFSFKDAILVVILRSFLTSIILGTFLSPGFIIGISGSIIGTIVMGTVFLIFKRFSIYGVSILGSVSNNLMQILVVYVLYINNQYVLWMLPLSFVLSLCTGIITAYFAKRILNHIINST